MEKLRNKSYSYSYSPYLWSACFISNTIRIIFLCLKITIFWSRDEVLAGFVESPDQGASLPLLVVVEVDALGKIVAAVPTIPPVGDIPQ